MTQDKHETPSQANVRRSREAAEANMAEINHLKQELDSTQPEPQEESREWENIVYNLLFENSIVDYVRVIHEDVWPVKELAQMIEEAIDTASQEGYEEGVKATMQAARETFDALMPSTTAPCCERAKAEERDRILEIGDSLREPRTPCQSAGVQASLPEWNETHECMSCGKMWSSTDETPICKSTHNAAIEAYQSAIKNYE